MIERYDVVVIGSGPGGCVAALKAAQLGYRTAVVEKKDVLGGNSTKSGCFPSKVFLCQNTDPHLSEESYRLHGMSLGAADFNFEHFHNIKNQVIQQNICSLNFLMKENRIDIYTGTGSFISEEQLYVNSKKGSQILESRYYIISTGSSAVRIPGINPDNVRIFCLESYLSINSCPKNLAIVGGGISGVEMAAFYARMGTKVTIFESSGSLIPSMDRELANILLKDFTDHGIKINFNCRVMSADNLGGLVSICYNDRGSMKQTYSEYCIVAAGRRSDIGDLNLEWTSTSVNESGNIHVDSSLRTSAANIFALGDVVEWPLPAHISEDHGAMIIENITGNKNMDRLFLPAKIVYANTEIASFGYSEEYLKLYGVDYNICRKSFPKELYPGRCAQDEGFIKLLWEPESGEMLGAHMMGKNAGELLTVSIRNGFPANTQQVAVPPYAHPTYAGILKKAFEKGLLNTYR